MNQFIDADIAIVGAGPVGAAAALALADIDSDLRILLVDREPVASVPAEQFDTRVFAVNAGSAELLDRLGVWSAVLGTRACAYQSMHVWDAEGTGFVDFSATELGVPQLGHIVEAGLIQQALDERIAQMPNIESLRPVDIRDLQLGEQGAELILQSGEILGVTLVVAADGARSMLRDMAGIGIAEDDCRQQALVANLQLEKPHANAAWQIFRPTGPLAFLPLADSDERTCSIVWTLDNAEAERVINTDPESFVAQLERAVESRFGRLQLLSERRAFPLVQRHAQTYKKGPLVLLGDAAHSIHPLAGLGANLGFQDVWSLAAELERAHRREIPLCHPQVLARYERQRRLDNELTLKAMALFRDAFADHGLALNALRNLGFKAFNRLPCVKQMVARHALMPR